MTVIAVCLALVACPASPREGIHHPVPIPPRGGQAIAETNVMIGQRLAAAYGWVGARWDCLYRLWNRESGWQVHDRNWSSQADGIPQSNPASKMASAGPNWRDDAATQIRWGLGYVKARYGDPCTALANSNAYGYY